MGSPETQTGSVHVFGLGVRNVAQITLESNYLLQQVDQVFHSERDPAVGEYIASIGRSEVSLAHLYADGRRREEVYREIADAIIRAARGGSKCAYLAPGNPVFLNTVVLNLKAVASRDGIPFFIYAGVSSIDTLLTDLFIPVERTGLQCFVATHFVRMRPGIDKRVPLLLFQPGVVGTYEVRYHSGAYLPGVKLLQESLVELYGAEQQWVLLRSAISAGDSAIISTGTLAELLEKGGDLELGTLLIPGEWECDKHPV